MDFAALSPLSGGWSGQTFLTEVAGERQVVRIYATPGHRGNRAHEVDAALLRLVRGLVPVPEVVEVRRPDPAAGTPALLISSFVPGARGDQLLPTLDESGLRRLGSAVGELVATLGGMPALRSGPFLDGDLTVGSFGELDGLPSFVEHHADRLPGFGTCDLDGLRAVAVEAQELLDTTDRICLVHSDLNPKNLLVDPETLEVRALVDWEYAHAGHPFTDLGNVLRFERQPAYVEAVLAAYASRHGTPPAVALALARAADLWALVDLAARGGSSPVADRAHDLLLGITRSRDAGWTPLRGRA